MGDFLLIVMSIYHNKSMKTCDRTKESKKEIPVWRQPAPRKQDNADYLELSGNPAETHFRDGLEAVYPQLVAYEKELREKLTRLNQELTHVQAQIAGIERILEKRDD